MRGHFIWRAPYCMQGKKYFKTYVLYDLKKITEIVQRIIPESLLFCLNLDVRDIFIEISGNM